MGYRIFALLFLFVGIWTMVDGTERALEGLRARSWPKAKGRILLSRYDAWRTKKNIRIAGLCIDVEYIYQVGDEIYEGNRVNSGWRCFGNQRHLETILKRYRSGKAVEVRFDPKDPTRSLLEPGVDWSSFFLWGIGIISLSAALPLFRSSIRPLRTSRT